LEFCCINIYLSFSKYGEIYNKIRFVLVCDLK
jgi:hypothetical protein